MANTLCSIKEKLAHENKRPNFYKRYVDDTFALVPDLTAHVLVNQDQLKEKQVVIRSPKVS